MTKRSRWNQNESAEDVDKIINYVFAFLLILLFILEADSSEHGWILVALFLSFLASLAAFFLNWLSLRALSAATLLGTITLGLGGWVPALLIAIFFCTSSLLSSSDTGHQPGMAGSSPGVASGRRAGERYRGPRRDGLQIWANGFWVVVAVMLWFITEVDPLLLAVAAAIASVTADTWATEVGSSRPRKTILLTDFTRVQSGDEGGVSLAGSTAGLLGALLIAICHSLFSGDFSVSSLLIILTGGVGGMLTDSFLGGLYHQERGPWRRHSGLSRWQYGPRSPEQVNNAINWLSSGAGAGIALLLAQLV